MFTGIHLRQWEDMSIELDQTEYVQSIDPINPRRAKKQNTEEGRGTQVLEAARYAADPMFTRGQA